MMEKQPGAKKMMENQPRAKEEMGGKQPEKVKDTIYCYSDQETGAIPVTSVDYLTLMSGKKLNDCVVDFHNQTQYNSLDPSMKENIVIFPSCFYTALTSEPEVGSDKEKRENKLPKGQQQYSRVSRWTKNMDLFNKTIIIFPIVEYDHWYAIVAVKLQSNKPIIMVLDSLEDGGDRDVAVKNIRYYLQQEGGRRMNVEVIYLCLPSQDDGYNCGAFLCTYIGLILDDVDLFIEKGYCNILHDWFAPSEVRIKRIEIAETVRRLNMDQQKGGPQVVFPDLYLEEGREKTNKSAIAEKVLDDRGKVQPKVEEEKTKIEIEAEESNLEEQLEHDVAEVSSCELNMSAGDELEDDGSLEVDKEIEKETQEKYDVCLFV